LGRKGGKRRGPLHVVEQKKRGKRNWKKSPASGRRGEGTLFALPEKGGTGNRRVRKIYINFGKEKGKKGSLPHNRLKRRIVPTQKEKLLIFLAGGGGGRKGGEVLGWVWRSVSRENKTEKKEASCFIAPVGGRGFFSLVIGKGNE